MIRVNAQGGFKIRDGRIQIAFFIAHESPIVIGGCMVCIKMKRTVIIRQCAVKITFVFEDVSTIKIRHRKVRAKTDGGIIVMHSADNVA